MILSVDVMRLLDLFIVGRQWGLRCRFCVTVHFVESEAAEVSQVFSERREAARITSYFALARAIFLFLTKDRALLPLFSTSLPKLSYAP
jgi:hypothetical protein